MNHLINCTILATALILIDLAARVSLSADTGSQDRPQRAGFAVPELWEYSAPLIAPERHEGGPSRAPKDPSVVFHDRRWHVFMSVGFTGHWAIEYCSFERWEEANRARRTLLKVSDSKYYGAPQVFYFCPHRKWYLIYQMEVSGKETP